MTSLNQICTVPIQRKRNAIMAWIAREKEPLKSILIASNSCEFRPIFPVCTFCRENGERISDYHPLGFHRLVFASRLFFCVKTYSTLDSGKNKVSYVLQTFKKYIITRNCYIY
ncbi:unnamed protein product [Rhizophagus irregularis]|uniref:Uncharacterized protein n=1 Tax=Rhizophagus irregularis TaxID=588596 RepID=A0A915ZIF1_9GLOM|nr:unnamed protein product [Rhizophagus irregularis]